MAKNLGKLPDPEKHRYVSFGKSAVRLAAAAALIASGVHALHSDSLLIVAGIGFVIAELLGILEEVV